MLLGLEVLLRESISLLKDQRIGLITNQSSVNQKLHSTLELFADHPVIDLRAVFSPQHGFWSEKQDNMIESEDFIHPLYRTPVYSLYGKSRQPTGKILSELDTIVFDLQDVGTRVYTYGSTMILAMKACREHKKKLIILDRPNPVNGIDMEGYVLNPKYGSFVGLYPLPMRHGLSLGEMAVLLNKEYHINSDITVIPVKGWKREMWFDQTGMSWINPSPNMPSLDCATVYPGTVALEGTNISEGRGTTRPFQWCGAPFIEPYQLAERLKKEKLPGVCFRPISFQPVSDKWKERVCGGVHIHVTDRTAFKPVLTGIALIKAVRHLYPERFQWRPPPYEYEYKKLPIDIIYGTYRARKHIESDSALSEIEHSWKQELKAFRQTRGKHLLYS